MLKPQEQYRITTGLMASTEDQGANGMFIMPVNDPEPDIAHYQIIISDGSDWRYIKGYEGIYLISKAGVVKAVNGLRILYTDTTSKGYPRVSLSKNGHTCKKLIHVLVAETYIHNQYCYPQVNHIDGNKGNCCVTNLEWCTREYNRHHAIENNLATGLKASEINEIKILLKDKTIEEVAVMYERHPNTIKDIKEGRHRDLTPAPPLKYTGLDLWEHLSVILVNKDFVPSNVMPSWDDMCYLKDLFWDPMDCVVQYHPPHSEYVNNHKWCLHLWRPTNAVLPMPDSIMVGIKDLDLLDYKNKI